ncbi:MAG: hypothetical protein KKE62_01955 [Proteobacteria bacterium]|nr:hypothetical protein [Pseudomonadota bacterium]MBU1387097.1 hypothetical protein [Pseudomonadota bacterium]MBU1541586.1 hypothetical protein [Pseudomonadota bacterium]MBU2429532.1 hypothetical protein [Pseudomonadota bacterium]MBU2482543.1 hypothetical protein [Pseudomonadota bacterium]
MYKIRSLNEGFRRAGIAFTREPVIFKDDQLTPDQVAMLEAERLIEIQHIPDLPQPDAEEEAHARKVLEKMTKDKLMKECDAIGIEYPDDATKAVLVDLLLINTAPPPEA